VGRIAAAKAEGLPVTAGVCPHHLWLTERDIDHLGSLGWMKPSLKTQADQDALWQALQDGTIDVVESDHAPHTLQEKTTSPPPYGVPGLETTLPLLCTALHEGRLSAERIIELVAENPRRIFGLECPPETYTVIDLGASRSIERQNLHTLCGWSPFEGMRVHGKVVETWIRGRKVYDGEQILAEPGFGRNVCI
jgi:dihydroorotase